MEQDELLRRLIERLELLDLPYLVTGSIATILYGEPRFTNDIDVVVQLPAELATAFLEAFPAPEFSVDSESARAAIAGRRQLNILHPASGLKVDVMIPRMDAFDHSRFSRARRVHPAPGLSADFAAPEDVILKKLQWYDQGGSEKHLRDIAGILRISPGEVDRDYITRWARELGLSELWERVATAARGE